MQQNQHVRFETLGILFAMILSCYFTQIPTMPELEKEKHKCSFTQEKRKVAMDLFNSFESRQFKVLVIEAVNDKYIFHIIS